jgi:formiminotetrahydrofolate cyclodeaminase
MISAIAKQTIEEFHDTVADTQVFCGGGSVAAVTAAGAASTALLVMRLNRSRKANAAHVNDIDRAIERTEAIVSEFHALADADIAALAVLLDAQRALRNDGDGARARYLDALLAAARSPVTIGEVGLELLHLIEAETPRAARFTISDLGAAAALLDGACQAAFLTSEVNIALLREASDADVTAVEAVNDRLQQLSMEIDRRARQIEELTRERIHRTRKVTQ